MAPDLAHSFALCRQIARKRARNFYYSFLLLPKAEKDAMCAVYAFMRHADDIADEPGATTEARRKALDDWRKNLDRPQHPTIPALIATIDRYQIPQDYFRELIAGVESDLEPRDCRTFDDLYRYCYQVASIVGMTTVHIFGFEDPKALELAEKCGIAFQLTNILRDIPEDAAAGRRYLPQEDLDRFSGTELMRFEYDRALAYYHEAGPLVEMVKPVNRPALWALITIYRRVLERIRQQDFDVYSRRPRLTALQKSAIVARAARARWLGGSLPSPA